MHTPQTLGPLSLPTPTPHQHPPTTFTLKYPRILTQVMPEVKAREAEEAAKREEERRLLQDLIQVRSLPLTGP